MSETRHRLLVVDDDPALLRILVEDLRDADYKCKGCDNGQDALILLRQEVFDLIVLDWTMPDFTGIEISRRLRKSSNFTPILMLTARDDMDERVFALDTGIDDYMTKPFETKELRARIRSMLRRVDYEKSTQDETKTIEIDTLRMNLLDHCVTRSERKINLSNREFELLKHLMKHPNQVLERKEIFKSVWGEDFAGDPNTLDVYIGYLRKKIETSGEAVLLHTVRGVGFMIMQGPIRK